MYCTDYCLLSTKKDMRVRSKSFGLSWSMSHLAFKKVAWWGPNPTSPKPASPSQLGCEWRPGLADIRLCVNGKSGSSKNKHLFNSFNLVPSKWPSTSDTSSCIYACICAFKNRFLFLQVKNKPCEDCYFCMLKMNHVMTVNVYVLILSIWLGCEE